MKYINDDLISHFFPIFEGLLLIKVNQEQDVKLIAENIDSLLKESVVFIFQDTDLYKIIIKKYY